MKTKKTRLFALLIALTMLFSLGSFSALGAEEKDATVDEATLYGELKAEAEDLGLKVSPNETLIDLYDKVEAARDKEELKSLKETAKDMGVKIDGLNLADAKKKLYDAGLKTDKKIVSNSKLAITALTDKNVTKVDEKKYKSGLKKLADTLDIDISGMTVKEIIAKLKASLGDTDISSASNSFEYKSLLEAALAIRNDNEKGFMDIVQTGIFDGIMKTKMSELPYADARNMLIEALKEHTKVDITAGTWSSVKSKVMAAIREGMKEEAAFYKVDISGLSDADAQAKIEVAKQIMMANEMVELANMAAIYGVDVTGLSKEEGWARVKAVMFAEIEKGDIEMANMAALYGIDITGLERGEIAEKVKFASAQAEAAKVGVDITGMGLEEAWKVIKEAQIKNAPPQENTLEQEAAKWSVDITGLSTEDAWAKVKAAREAIEKSKNVTPTPTPTDTP